MLKNEIEKLLLKCLRNKERKHRYINTFIEEWGALLTYEFHCKDNEVEEALTKYIEDQTKHILDQYK